MDSDQQYINKLDEKIDKTIKIERYKWFNLFVRDILLIVVVGFLQWWTRYNSKVIFFISGMLLVWITWQLSDLLNYRRKVVDGNP